MSAEDFIVWCIEMKMKWLARRLRLCDKPSEIDTWVISTTLLVNLLQKINVEGASCPVQRAEKNEGSKRREN